MTADHHQDDQDVDSLGVLDGNDYKTIVEMETFKSEVGNLLLFTRVDSNVLRFTNLFQPQTKTSSLIHIMNYIDNLV